MSLPRPLPHTLDATNSFGVPGVWYAIPPTGLWYPRVPLRARISANTNTSAPGTPRYTTSTRPHNSAPGNRPNQGPFSLASNRSRSASDFGSVAAPPGTTNSCPCSGSTVGFGRPGPFVKSTGELRRARHGDAPSAIGPDRSAACRSPDPKRTRRRSSLKSQCHADAFWPATLRLDLTPAITCQPRWRIQRTSRADVYQESNNTYTGTPSGRKGATSVSICHSRSSLLA